MRLVVDVVLRAFLQSRSHSEDPQHQQLRQRAKEVGRVFDGPL